jgi:hypothetical protein
MANHRSAWSYWPRRVAAQIFDLSPARTRYGPSKQAEVRLPQLLPIPKAELFGHGGRIHQVGEHDGHSLGRRQLGPLDPVSK